MVSASPLTRSSHHAGEDFARLQAARGPRRCGLTLKNAALRHGLTRRLHYTPEQLFDLVGDVERYPAFVPWVTDMRTWGRRESEPGVVVFDAEAKVRFAIIREHFSTRVRLDAANLTIDVPTCCPGPSAVSRTTGGSSRSRAGRSCPSASTSNSGRASWRVCSPPISRGPWRGWSAASSAAPKRSTGGRK